MLSRRTRTRIKKEEEIKEMVEGNSSKRVKRDNSRKRVVKEEEEGNSSKRVVKEEEDKNNSRYLRECKRVRWESIPEKILFEILVRVPAQDIYYASRLVCKKWNHVASDKDFIQKHLENSSYGLLYMDESGSFAFLQVGAGGELEKHKLLRYNLYFFTCFATSCNGLMLRHERVYHEARIYITNISTNCAALLLPERPWDSRFCLNSCGIAFDACSMKYKVFVRCTGTEYGNALAILTVGKGESWRFIHFDDPPRLREARFWLPYVTGGFVHWFLYSDKVLATLDLTLFQKPQGGNWAWQVFEMKPDTGEWKEVANICLDGDRIKQLGFEPDEVEIKPCSWLKYPEVLALRVDRGFIIFYNLIKRQILDQRLSLFQHCMQVAFHKNSLLYPPLCI